MRRQAIQATLRWLGLDSIYISNEEISVSEKRTIDRSR